MELSTPCQLHVDILNIASYILKAKLHEFLWKHFINNFDDSNLAHFIVTAPVTTAHTNPAGNKSELLYKL